MRLILSLLFFLLPSYTVVAGAWGYGSFENDSANDWVFEIEQTQNTDALLQSLINVFTDQYIEVDACSHAIAASEVIASFKAGDFKRLPASLSSWAKKHKSKYEPEMSKLALKALEQCKNIERSELAQLWKEGGSKEWLLSIKEIEAVLK